MWRLALPGWVRVNPNPIPQRRGAACGGRLYLDGLGLTLRVNPNPIPERRGTAGGGRLYLDGLGLILTLSLRGLVLRVAAGSTWMG